MKIVLSRVCSVRRSGTQALFFEEAQNPILSVEATVPQKQSCDSSKQLASAGFSLPSTTSQNGSLLKVLLNKVSLASVDLLKGRYKTEVDYGLKTLKQRFPNEWKNTMVSVKVCDDTNNDGFCSNEDANHTLSVANISFMAKRVPSSLTVDVWSGRNLTLATDAEMCEKQYSPIVLDLSGDGIQLVGPETGVRFDLNDTGTPITTGWVTGSDNAFLVRDVNSNGRIDSGAELFGSATRLSNGLRALNGFEAMKELDSDRDNQLTPKDKKWGSLRLWLDNNHNGISEKGEIITLKKAGIESLNLSYVDTAEVDEYGNQSRQRSTFRRILNGKSTAHLMVDVWFNTLVNQ